MAKKFLSDIELDAGLVDVNGNTGTSGQILSSTGTAVDWVNQADVVAGEADKALSLTLRVKNTESVALTKGQVVCAAPTASPPSGNVIEVKLADNNGTDSMPAIGILNEGLDAAGGANDEGEAIMFGRVSGLDTSAFSVGDEVFVSDTAGGLTTTKPTGVKYIQKVGVVMRDDATNGTIEVFGAGRTNDVPTPLYIDHANQRVGIGETNPAQKLHVIGNSEITGDIFLGRYIFHNDDTNTWLGFPLADTISFRTNGSDRMYITSSGNIGVGTTSPSSKLQVFGDLTVGDDGLVGSWINVITAGSSQDAGIRFGSESNTDSKAAIYTNTSNSDLHFDVTETTRMLIDSATGNVGIGTTSPVGKLSIGSGLSTDNSTMFNVDGQYNDVGFNGGTSGLLSQGVWSFINSATWDQTRFYVQDQNNSDSRLTFDFKGNAGNTNILAGTSSGKVGIGTTSPSYKLDIAGNLRVDNGNIGSTSGDELTHARVQGARHFIDFKEVRTANDTDWRNTTFKIQTGVDSTKHQSIDFVADGSYQEHIDIRTGNQVFNTRFTYDGKVGIGTTSPQGLLHVSSGTSGDAIVIIEADTDNSNENDNPQLQFKQDAGGIVAKAGLIGDPGQIFTNSLGNGSYFGTDSNASVQFYTNGAAALTIREDGDVGIGTNNPTEALDVNGSIKSNGVIWTGYDSGVVGSVSCSGWFRSNGSTGWYNASYGGGIYMTDSTWVRVYNNKKFYNQNTIESNTAMYAPVFYDRNNTDYRFHGDQSNNSVDLTSSGNYAIHVAGTIGGGHRKHNNLETPEMQWSVGGSTDLNWKKLFDVVVTDALYGGWGAEIEITDFGGNFGNGTYNGGELYKGALSIYHWGGTGNTPETPYANIPYQFRNDIRWYKIQESGQNRYQLQVKSPANYRQLYIKVKPGIGNQIADIIGYANDTDGATSGGTAYASIQNADFNHEFAGDIWTNDSRSIGFRNGYGSPHFSTYYGSLTTNTSVYIGGPTGNGQDLYCDDLRSNIVYDRAATSYYFEGGNTGDSIRVAGDVVAYYSSDKRLKDNIKPIENALDKVNALSGVTFEWNEKSHKTTGRKDVGVVAQEVEEVFPEIVETRTNGYKAVDYQKLTAVLIESVKELSAKVQALEAKQCNCK